MLVREINNIILEPKGVAVMRDRNGWPLDTIINKRDKGITFQQMANTGKLGEDAVLFPYLKQRAKVQETNSCGQQILDIWMEWEV